MRAATRMEARPCAGVEEVRAFHRRFPTGVAVVTTMADGGPRGMAINAFASVCIDPPTVLVCIARSASTHGPLLEAGIFAVNLLAAGQEDVATAFARSGGSEKFDAAPWRRGVSGAPILEGVCAHLEAEVDTLVDAHTHTMVLGRVVHAAATDRRPLGYLDGAFFDTATINDRKGPT